MDIISVGEGSIRIKGKSGSVVIDPTSQTTKTEAQAVIALNSNSGLDSSRVEGSRISIKGPGEYEVSGIKISAIKSDSGITLRLDVDNVKIIAGDGVGIEKNQDKLEEAQILLVKANEQFNYSVLTTLEPKVILVYGIMASEVAKALGKEGIKTSKFSTTSEKLPQELEFYYI